jgi:hypothetical protein
MPVLSSWVTKIPLQCKKSIADKVGDTRTTRVVCRTGNAIEATDLQLVSLQTAKSIIVVRPDGEDPDSQVIKVLLPSPNHQLAAPNLTTSSLKSTIPKTSMSPKWWVAMKWSLSPSVIW